MARRLGVLKQQQPLAVFVDLNLIMFPARECIRRMDGTIWWGWNALKAIVGLVLRVVSSNLAMIYSHLMRVRGITGKSMGGWKKRKTLGDGRKETLKKFEEKRKGRMNNLDTVTKYECLVVSRDESSHSGGWVLFFLYDIGWDYFYSKLKDFLEICYKISCSQILS